LVGRWGYSDTGRRRHNLFSKNLTHVDVKKGLANKAGTDDSEGKGKNTDRESCHAVATHAMTHLHPPMHPPLPSPNWPTPKL